jgi:signal transduction histidine kinase/CheY-like chemotaxis protein
MWINNIFTRKNLSWSCPLVLFIIETVLAGIAGGSHIYFYLLFVNLAISFLFMIPQGILIYILLSNISLIPLLFIQSLNIMGPYFSRDHAAVTYIITLVVSFIIYAASNLIVRYVTRMQKSGIAFETIMDITPSYMVALNSDAAVEYLSDSLLRSFGLSQKQYALNRPLLDLIPSGQMKMMIQEVMEQKGFVEKNFEIDNDGRKNWYMLRSSLMGKDKPNRFFEWTDITPIMEAKNEAESAAQAKTDFLASISHEIRTPMNAILGMTDLMLSDNLDDEQRSRAQTIKGAAFSLLNIINDVLDFSKIDAQKMEIIPKPFNFAAFINDTVNIISIRTSEKGLAFTTFISKDIPSVINTDELRLKQSLINILNNAAKFTKEGSIHLRSWTEPLEDGRLKLYFSVQDTGIGIRQEDIGKLFEKFRQLDTRRNRDLLGTGLGLSISNRLVELMGGAIIAESEYGKGSLFTFYVICYGNQEDKLASVPYPDKLYILCYEPNPYNALAMNRMLESLQVPHDIAGNKDRMQKLLEKCVYTHLFFDISGAELAAKFAEEQKYHSILIQEITGKREENIRFSIKRPILIGDLADILNGGATEAGLLSRMRNESSNAFMQTRDVSALVVDDNSVNLLVARGLLGKFGISVDTADGGLEAITKIKQKNYDIIFMDHMMPGVDGIDATRQIRDLGGRYSSLVIVALTANAVSGMEELFLSSGMDGFLPKPIMINELREILLRFLGPEKIVN